MNRNLYRPGDLVVYRMPKLSTHPGPRAEEVLPARAGDTYSYCVDKFWRVAETLADGRVLVRTRRGKKRVVKSDTPNLRHATWWERLRYRNRFPEPDEQPQAAAQS